MIQEIYPKVFYPEFRNKKATNKKSFVLHFEYNKVMLIKDVLTGEIRLPRFEDLEEDDENIYEKSYYVNAVDDEEFYLVDDMQVPEFGGFYMEGMQVLREFSPQYQAFATISASQVYRWMKSRKYCGYCGTVTEKSNTERALICPKCKNIEYPKISPAIIVAIRDGNRLLLTKNAKGTYKFYALVAGFVEVGESLEDAVRREVMEEVGLKVKNIQSYKSQPWSFSDSLMLAFIADLDGDDKITIQEEELSEARWFEREDVPVLPFHISVGHELIQKFRDGEI
nr:NAD(+) diphosphatase [uncultured Lachnoanaerobaculum sp.]